MPNPHFDITITSRSKGMSAVAGAAYQSGERIFSEKMLHTHKSYFRQMHHRSMRTEQFSGTLSKKLRNNGTHSLPDVSFWLFQKKSPPNTILKWSLTTVKNILYPRGCVAILPFTTRIPPAIILIAM